MQRKTTTEFAKIFVWPHVTMTKDLGKNTTQNVRHIALCLVQSYSWLVSRFPRSNAIWKKGVQNVNYTYFELGSIFCTYIEAWNLIWSKLRIYFWHECFREIFLYGGGGLKYFDKILTLILQIAIKYFRIWIFNQ